VVEVTCVAELTSPPQALKLTCTRHLEHATPVWLFTSRAAAEVHMRTRSKAASAPHMLPTCPALTSHSLPTPSPHPSCYFHPPCPISSSQSHPHLSHSLKVPSGIILSRHLNPPLSLHRPFQMGWCSQHWGTIGKSLARFGRSRS